MKKIILFCTVAVFAFSVFCSCNSKERSISKLESLVNEVNENADHYTAQDWEKVSARYEDILTQLEKYEKDLTMEDNQKLLKLSEQFQLTMAEKFLSNGAQKFLDDADDMMDDVDDMMDDVDDMFDE